MGHGTWDINRTNKGIKRHRNAEEIHRILASWGFFRNFEGIDRPSKRLSIVENDHMVKSFSSNSA